DLLGVFIRRATFDGLKPTQRTAALIAFEHQPGLEPIVADHVPRDDETAFERTKRSQRVAKLPVLPLIGDVQNAFELCLLHCWLREPVEENPRHPPTQMYNVILSVLAKDLDSQEMF